MIKAQFPLCSWASHASQAVKGAAMADFLKYLALRDERKAAAEAYYIARADGLNTIGAIRMLCDIYQLTLIEAKAVINNNRRRSLR